MGSLKKNKPADIIQKLEAQKVFQKMKVPHHRLIEVNYQMMYNYFPEKEFFLIENNRKKSDNYL